MRQPISVHFSESPQPVLLEYLHSILDPAVQVTLGPALPAPAAFHILVDGSPTRELLAASRVLRSVIIPYTGLSPARRALLLEFPHLTVHNIHGRISDATAEMAIALLLAAAKFIVPMDRALRAADWTPGHRGNLSVVLAGKTALVVGYGAIGQRVARVCRGLGMRVLAVSRSGDVAHGGPDEVYPVAALHKLLPLAQALIVALPLTEETQGLIGERELDLLPSGSVLVNVGRGPVVDERALYEVLASRRLRAAGLDVWYNYPSDETNRSATAPSSYPFGELDNVVLSPHRGGMSEEEDAQKARLEEVATIINAIARGEPAPNRVDVERGY